LELEANELQAEYRPALTAAGREGREAEIFILDTLPGGAGFAQRVGQLGLVVFEDALRVFIRDAPKTVIVRAIVVCGSYKNKFEHDLLDRQLGRVLCGFLLLGSNPTLGPSRIAASTDLLFEDLQRKRFRRLTIQSKSRDIAFPISVQQQSPYT
jgi:hypothetical protein